MATFERLAISVSRQLRAFDVKKFIGSASGTKRVAPQLTRVSFVLSLSMPTGSPSNRHLRHEAADDSCVDADSSEARAALLRNRCSDRSVHGQDGILCVQFS